MSKEVDLDLPPAYTDSVSVGSEIIYQAREIRENHVKRVVGPAILEYMLKSRASKGISHWKIALIPRDALPPSSEPGSYKILLTDTDDDEQIEQYHLKDDLDTQEFWKQDRVLEDLRAFFDQQFPKHIIVVLAPAAATAESVRSRPKANKRPSFFRISRNKLASAPTVVAPRPTSPAVKVIIQRDDLRYLAPNEYGVYEIDPISRVAIVISFRFS